MNGPTTMLAGPPHRRTQGLGALESGGAFNLCLFQRTCDPRELTIRKFFEITHPPARADERTRRALELYLCLPQLREVPASTARPCRASLQFQSRRLHMELAQ
jgi:hypothetical protein